MATFDDKTGSPLQISPDGSHAAFLTAARLTSYDNQGWREMYTYNPETGAIRCASCIPDGDPPTGPAAAGESGLAQFDRSNRQPTGRDGQPERAVSWRMTAGSCSPPPMRSCRRDTDGLVDVYEFVGGRPRLISIGTAQADLLPGNHFYPAHTPGSRRSATTGSTSSSRPTTRWPPQDHNGPFIKFYDARTNGGFPTAAGICPASPPTSVTAREARRRRPADTDRCFPRRRNDASKRKTAKHKKRHKKAVEGGATSGSAGQHHGERMALNRLLATLAAAVARRGPDSGALRIGRSRSRKSPSSAPTYRRPRRAGTPMSTTKSTWTARNSSQPAVHCEDAEGHRHAFPDGLHRRSTQRPSLQAHPIRTALLRPGVPRWECVEIQGTVREAMFNLVPHADEAGLIGFYMVGANTALFIVLHARTGPDYGLDATNAAIYQFFRSPRLQVHLWGVPAHPSHDANRFPVDTPRESPRCKPYPEGCYGPVSRPRRRRRIWRTRPPAAYR